MVIKLLLLCLMAAVSVSDVSAQSFNALSPEEQAINQAMESCETPEGVQAECFEYIKNLVLVWITLNLPVAQPPRNPTPGPWADDPEHR